MSNPLIERMERRKAELARKKEKASEDALLRSYNKTGAKKYLHFLQGAHGYDCDYQVGYDDGEAPKGYN